MILLGLVLFSHSILNLRPILLPLSFALMLAILLNPIVNKFEQWKLPTVFAIILTIVLTLLLTLGIAYFLSSQVIRFGVELPLLKKKFAQLAIHAQAFLNDRLHVSLAKQEQMMQDAESSVRPLIMSTLGTMAGFLTIIVLVPVYTFLFLFYKKLLLNFVFEIFAEKNTIEVTSVLKQTKSAIQSYMMGLILEAVIVASLNTLALLLLGVRYAVLIGVIGAIVNVLPYIGGLIAIALPLIIATITKDGFHTQVLIAAAYVVIQFLDNHFIVPYIVSSKVKINALVSIIAVLLGGAVWGIGGMFLSIPFIGILKIIFDRVQDLKPWGKLLGDEVPTRHKGQIWSLRRKKIESAENV